MKTLNKEKMIFFHCGPADREGVSVAGFSEDPATPPGSIPLLTARECVILSQAKGREAELRNHPGKVKK